MEDGLGLGPFGSVGSSTPLLAAADAGHSAIVKLLISAGATPQAGATVTVARRRRSESAAPPSRVWSAFGSEMGEDDSGLVTACRDWAGRPVRRQDPETVHAVKHRLCVVFPLPSWERRCLCVVFPLSFVGKTPPLACVSTAWPGH